MFLPFSFMGHGDLIGPIANNDGESNLTLHRNILSGLFRYKPGKVNLEQLGFIASAK